MAWHGERITWQIKVRIFDLERWVDMDDRLHELTHQFFCQHTVELNEYKRRRRYEGITEDFRPSHFQATYDGTRIYDGSNRGYLWDFMGYTFGDPNIYSMSDLVTGDTFAIRRIKYEVLAPGIRAYRC